jgi:predicted MPP superfamily phosphohydrolase
MKVTGPLDVGQEGVLLRLVEAVHLVDETGWCAPAAPCTSACCDRLADVLDPGEHRRQGDELGIEASRHQPRQRGLAHARRAPEDHRMRLPDSKARRSGLPGPSRCAGRSPRRACAAAGARPAVYGGIARLTHLPRPDSATAYVGLTLLVAALWLMGFNSARNPKIERLTIESDKVPTQADGLRIVQLTDVHLGVLINRQHLTRILEQVETLKPDILVSTGDLVDAQAHHLDGLSTLLADCKPRYGKFAVTGNHESYVGLDHALAFHERAGFRLLRGDSIDVAGITLAGIDDPAVIGGSIGEAKFLNEIREGRFVILLKHQPRIDPDARFDLQLSGHTHNGQIFPFNFLVKLVYPMIQGRHGLNNGGQLYVSRGAGSWGPPIRVFSSPEITLIELKRR